MTLCKSKDSTVLKCQVYIALLQYLENYLRSYFMSVLYTAQHNSVIFSKIPNIKLFHMNNLISIFKWSDSNLNSVFLNNMILLKIFNNNFSIVFKYLVKLYMCLIVSCGGSQIIWSQRICILLKILTFARISCLIMLSIDIYFIIN